MRSYDLPHRLHAAKVYPLTAPDASTVIVYGHENGVRVIWRHSSRAQERREAVELHHADPVHIVDVSTGGSEALRIAFPPLPSELNHDTKNIPKLLFEKIVIAVACSDCNIRIVSLPLLPPQSQNAPDQVLLVSGEHGHQSLPNCIAVTFTPHLSPGGTNGTKGTANHPLKQTTSYPEAGSSSNQSSAQAILSWDLLVASHSSDFSGRLIIHRLPCDQSTFENFGIFCGPCDEYRLPSPAVSVSFSSALYPSPYHSRLLVAEGQGAIRIMQYTPQIANEPWLASLYTDFDSPSYAGLPRRKFVLDSRWLLGGKVIIVLMSSGEWGIWDIENAGPQVAKNILQTQNFTVTSRLVSDSWVQVKAAKSTMSSMNTNSTTSGLAPMTPSTRTSRKVTLFSSTQQQLQRRSLRGGISVIASSNVSSSRADDETVLFWHGTNIVTIPSFFAYWQNQVRSSGNLYGSGSTGEIQSINNVQFRGEEMNEVSLSPGSNRLEIVIAAERRLLVVAAP